MTNVIDIKVSEEDYKEAKSYGYAYGIRLVRTQSNRNSSSNLRQFYVYVVFGERIEDKSARGSTDQSKLFAGCTVCYALKDEDLDKDKYIDTKYNLIVRVLRSSSGLS
ncbi:MAG: hypothetical protein ACK6CP_08660 [Pseudanabaena sp.]|jgi:hypothetical protein